MKRTRPRNLSASVRDRLLKLAAQRQEDFGLLLTKFGMERLLYRLGQSQYRDVFILKGALLFEAWTERRHRPTRDIDLLGKRVFSEAETTRIFREICGQSVDDDGLNLRPESIRVERIREQQGYEGLRVRCVGRLGNIRIPLQVDIGFGDPVVPAPIGLTYPVLLDFPAPTIRAYPPETVVAEKFHAMVRFGIVNSRMKDYFDIWVLRDQFEFGGDVLAKAIAATFRAQHTALPALAPVALSEEFTNDPAKKAQWRAFVLRNGLETGAADLERVVADLEGFLMPVVQALASGLSFRQLWQPGGPWKPKRGHAEA